MKQLLILLITVLVYISCDAQNEKKCRSTLAIKAKLCNYRFARESSCVTCDTCGIYLVAENPDIKILGFRMSVVDNQEGDVLLFPPNKGGKIEGYTKIGLHKATRGDSVIFECIEAANASGRVYILPDLVIEL